MQSSKDGSSQSGVLTKLDDEPTLELKIIFKLSLNAFSDWWSSPSLLQRWTGGDLNPWPLAISEQNPARRALLPLNYQPYGQTSRSFFFPDKWLFFHIFEYLIIPGLACLVVFLREEISYQFWEGYAFERCCWSSVTGFFPSLSLENWKINAHSCLGVGLPRNEHGWSLPENRGTKQNIGNLARLNQCLE